MGRDAERHASPGVPGEARWKVFRRGVTLRAAVIDQRPVDSALNAYPDLPLRRSCAAPPCGGVPCLRSSRGLIAPRRPRAGLSSEKSPDTRVYAPRHKEPVRPHPAAAKVAGLAP